MVFVWRLSFHPSISSTKKHTTEHHRWIEPINANSNIVSVFFSHRRKCLDERMCEFVLMCMNLYHQSEAVLRRCRFSDILFILYSSLFCSSNTPPPQCICMRVYVYNMKKRRSEKLPFFNARRVYDVIRDAIDY